MRFIDLRNPRGFTLVEMAIATALLGVVMLGGLSMVNWNAKVQRGVEQGFTVDGLNSQALLALTDVDSCKATFNGIAFPPAGGSAALNQVVKVSPGGTAIEVLKKQTTPSPGQKVYVSDLRLLSTNELLVQYTRVDEPGAPPSNLIRKLMVPIRADGTNILCVGLSSLNADDIFKDACLASGGVFDPTLTGAARCKHCAITEYNADPTGAALNCRPLAEKACQALGATVAYWDGSACRNCPNPGDILKKTNTLPFDPATDCIASLDPASLEMAFNCAAPNIAKVNRNPAGTLQGDCILAAAPPPPPPPLTNPTSPPGNPPPAPPPSPPACDLAASDPFRDPNVACNCKTGYNKIFSPGNSLAVCTSCFPTGSTCNFALPQNALMSCAHCCQGYSPTGVGATAICQ